MDKLTNKQQRFIDEYLIDLNATQAAIRAGYSEDTAAAIGCENLTKPNIQKAITAGHAKIAERNAFSQDVARQMFMDAFELAKKENNPSAMNGSVTGLCKLYGVNEPERTSIINENPEPMEINFTVDKALGDIKITRGKN